MSDALPDQTIAFVRAGGLCCVTMVGESRWTLHCFATDLHFQIPEINLGGLHLNTVNNVCL